MLYQVNGRVKAYRECPHCDGSGTQGGTLDVKFEITAAADTPEGELVGYAETALRLQDGWEFDAWTGEVSIAPLTPRAVMERAGLPDLFALPAEG